MSKDPENFCPSCHEGLVGQHCSPCDVPALLHGRYLLKRMLGRGANGYTWLALDTTDNKEYAIKELNVRRMDSFKQLELFEREASVLRALDHPAIPTYYDDFHTEDRRLVSIYLVQEFVDGKALDLKTPRTLAEVMELLRQIADVLEYLHGLHPPVYHRDIKPSNIMQRDDGSFVLIDFGSTRAAVEDTVGGSTVAGTFGYMAPEQFAGRAHAGVDIYGLGATAIALLSGRDASQAIDPQAPEAWKERLNLPQHTTDLLARMVHPDPDQRVQDVGELHARLLKKANRAPARPVDTPAPVINRQEFRQQAPTRPRMKPSVSDEDAARKAIIEKLAFKDSGARFEKVFATKQYKRVLQFVGAAVFALGVALVAAIAPYSELAFFVILAVVLPLVIILNASARTEIARYFDLPANARETAKKIDDYIAFIQGDPPRQGTPTQRRAQKFTTTLAKEQACTRLKDLSDTLLRQGPRSQLPALGVQLFRSAALGEPPDLSTLLSYGRLADRPSHGEFLRQTCWLYTPKDREHAYLLWLVADHILRSSDKRVFEEEVILDLPSADAPARLHKTEEVAIHR